MPVMKTDRKLLAKLFLLLCNWKNNTLKPFLLYFPTIFWVHKLSNHLYISLSTLL